MREGKGEVTIDVSEEGLEEVTEKVESLTDVIGGFPAQVTIRGARNCTFNIYPSQTMIMGQGSDGET